MQRGFCYNEDMSPEFPQINVTAKTALDRFLYDMDQQSMVFKRSKTKDLIFTMTHPSHHKTIAKLTQNKAGQVLLWMRFSASTDYGTFFNQKLVDTLAEDDYKYTGCYPGCTKCETPRGYTIYSPKGTFFRCHVELICVGPIEAVLMDEAIRLIKIQNAYESNAMHVTR